MKQRFKNYGLWLSIAALLLDILIYAGLLPLTEVEHIDLLVQRALELLVMVGILSNPTRPDGKGYNL